jgi:hypothetical protein
MNSGITSMHHQYSFLKCFFEGGVMPDFHFSRDLRKIIQLMMVLEKNHFFYWDLRIESLKIYLYKYSIPSAIGSFSLAVECRYRSALH